MTLNLAVNWKLAAVALGLPLITSGCYATGYGAGYYSDPYYNAGNDYAYCNSYHDGYYPSGYDQPTRAKRMSILRCFKASSPK